MKTPKGKPFALVNILTFKLMLPCPSGRSITSIISLILILSSVCLYGTSIQFGNQTIFYGIGQDTVSGYWSINQSTNNFSGQDIGTFYSDTQLWIIHHALSLKQDEGDSLIDYAYLYRYYKRCEAPGAWRELEEIMNGPFQHVSGFWYSSGYLDDAVLFLSSLDTGSYYLEFQHTATVTGMADDTLVQTYVLPDSSEFKAGFTVIAPEQSGIEGSTPIELASFRAEALQGRVELNWSTENETENSHFLIYRDDDVIGRIDGAGTTTETNEYAYTDAAVVPGVHSYAIADVTYGGVEELHDAVLVEVGEALVEADFVLNKAYPNPFNPSITINYQLSTINSVSAFIYNTHGNMIKELVNDEMNAGSHTLTWNADGMPSGVYVLKMIVGDVVQSQKLVLMK